MRTAGKMKAGFYPTPAEVVDLIADFIKRPLFHEGIRLLDPCAGEGEALRVLASRLGVKETYGVELDQTRAKQAGRFVPPKASERLSGSHVYPPTRFPCYGNRIIPHMSLFRVPRTSPFIPRPFIPKRRFRKSAQAVFITMGG